MDIIQGLLIYTKILAADCVIFILIRVLKKGETIPRRNKKKPKSGRKTDKTIVKKKPKPNCPQNTAQKTTDNTNPS